jgi:hypothetical protein
VEVFSPFQCGGIVDGVGLDGENWMYVFIFCGGGFFWDFIFAVEYQYDDIDMAFFGG